MSEMTSRERVRMAIEQKEPDRVPVDFISFQNLITDMGPYGYYALREYLGLADDDREIISALGCVQNMDPRILDRLGNDFRPVNWGPIGVEEIEEDYVRYVPFGFLYKNVGHYSYPDFENAPLKDAQTVADIENHPYWVDPDNVDPKFTEGKREEAKDLHENTDFAIVAQSGFVGYFFHVYTFLRGFNKAFIDMKQNPDLYHALMSHITDSMIALARPFYEEVGDYIDMAQVCGDDMGWQYGPFLSNEMFREFIKPYALKYNQTMRELTDAKFFYHCDGAIYPLIEEFIDMGYDVTSPIMYGCKDMAPAKLKKRYGGRITFHCGIDPQDVMAFGSVEEVKKHVTEVVKTLAPGGGYIFALTDIKPETPPEQIVAAFDTAMEVGKYPIR